AGIPTLASKGFEYEGGQCPGASRILLCPNPRILSSESSCSLLGSRRARLSSVSDLIMSGQRPSAIIFSIDSLSILMVNFNAVCFYGLLMRIHGSQLLLPRSRISFATKQGGGRKLAFRLPVLRRE